MKNIPLKVIILFVTILVIISSYYNFSYAETKISNDDLKKAFQSFVNSQANNNNYKIEVKENNIISISTSTGEKYNLSYDLENNITFKLEMSIKNGMSYTDFKRQTDNLILPMIGYLAVANVKGIDFNDSNSYFSTIHMNSKWNGNFTSNNSFSIIDDNGNTVSSGGSKNIKTSEFPNRVMEYINTIYQNKEKIDDSNNIKSFDWTIEKQQANNSNSSCKLISTITVNSDADFSKLKNYANTETENSNSVENTNQTINLSESQNIQNYDDTVKNGTLPAVGNGKFIGIIGIIIIGILIIIVIRSREYKE